MNNINTADAFPLALPREELLSTPLIVGQILHRSSELDDKVVTLSKENLLDDEEMVIAHVFARKSLFDQMGVVSKRLHERELAGIGANKDDYKLKPGEPVDELVKRMRSIQTLSSFNPDKKVIHQLDALREEHYYKVLKDGVRACDVFLDTQYEDLKLCIEEDDDDIATVWMRYQHQMLANNSSPVLAVVDIMPPGLEKVLELHRFGFKWRMNSKIDLDMWYWAEDKDANLDLCMQAVRGIYDNFFTQEQQQRISKVLYQLNT